jgi:hypothetical protein
MKGSVLLCTLITALRTQLTDTRNTFFVKTEDEIMNVVFSRIIGCNLVQRPEFSPCGFQEEVLKKKDCELHLLFCKVS